MGHDLIYTVATNGDVTLVSHGKDNMPGGSNDNVDIIGVFASKKRDGTWSDELADWKLDPFEPLRRR